MSTAQNSTVAQLQAAVEQAFGRKLTVAAIDGQAFPEWQAVSQVVAALARDRGDRVVAISGSQGSGKSTLANILSTAMQAQGVPARACSLDDFYLPRDARAVLADTVHPLLQTRGVPGTHDWGWLAEVLSKAQAGGGVQHLPQFDKGLDDRVATVEVSANLLVLEGWCLGVTPQPAEQLTTPCNDLEAGEDPQGIWRAWVNWQITAHYLPLWRQVDLWIHLRVPGFSQVLEWRTHAEQQIPANLRMSNRALERFIAHYERLTRWMWHEPAAGPGLVISLDAAHNVSDITVADAAQIQV